MNQYVGHRFLKLTRSYSFIPQTVYCNIFSLCFIVCSATWVLFITPCVTLSGFVFSILVLAHLVSVKTSPQSAMFPRDCNWFLARQRKAVLTQKKIEMRRTCVWHSYFPPTSLAVVLFPHSHQENGESRKSRNKPRLSCWSSTFSPAVCFLIPPLLPAPWIFPSGVPWCVSMRERSW